MTPHLRPDLPAAIDTLRDTLGDYLQRHRPDGVFHAQVGGPGSVPHLADLDLPEIHLDLLPGDPSANQARALEQLGYVQETPATWRHPGGWRLVLPDHDTGWRAEQAALRDLLMDDKQAAAQYRHAYQQGGRAHADDTLRDAATQHYAQTVGLKPLHIVADLLSPLGLPWMFAAGTALDLHLGRITRPHDDLDVIYPRDQQEPLIEVLQAQGWRLDTPTNGEYHAYTAPIQPPQHQIHARHPDLPGVIMLDLLLTDLSGGQWHYRRDPSITRPLDETRRTSPDDLPYLTPEAVLLFKASTGGSSPRPKDERDFQTAQPTLDAQARGWLREVLENTQPGHPWLKQLP